MRKLLVFALMLTFVGSAVAYDLGNARPDKPVVNYPQNVPNPDRQGGDTILDAVMVMLPVIDGTGTTVGYNDDYDEVCPYTNSTSPDVVYTFIPDMDTVVDVDLCGSAYDTKLYMYDENLNLVSCNDDFYFDDVCGVYVSKLEGVAVTAGVQYFVIIDGYGGDAGEYVINITEFEPCVIDCPPGATLEGEPPLQLDYVDDHNGGCNNLANPVFQPITDMMFCGVSGFYLNQGAGYRDTDWFTLEIPEGGVLEIVGDAELLSWMFELGPQDCGAVGVVQQVGIGPCAEGTMTITGNAGDEVWFWVGPQTFASPDGSDVYEFDYVLITNLVTATENHTLTGVKALFN